ncbi:hypothetical protein DVH24_015698 [Malus domestica]|uniref:Uncharacterized protein n=1 Tax=Malus domestica TaxID=3750 RepID=A0A498HHX3_MALDO|nr:hypothetical protein DVH24_015698 [Malus domestica]
MGFTVVGSMGRLESFGLVSWVESNRGLIGLCDTGHERLELGRVVGERRWRRRFRWLGFGTTFSVHGSGLNDEPIPSDGWGVPRRRGEREEGNQT